MYYQSKVCLWVKGEDKPKKHIFLFESPTYGYVEATVEKKIPNLCSLDSISKTSYYEIIRGEGGTWYSVKVNFFTEDDKKIGVMYLVQADSIDDASKIITEKEHLNSSVGEIAKVEETKIVEVFEIDKEE